MMYCSAKGNLTTCDCRAGAGGDAQQAACRVIVVGQDALGLDHALGLQLGCPAARSAPMW